MTDDEAEAVLGALAYGRHPEVRAGVYYTPDLTGDVVSVWVVHDRDADRYAGTQLATGRKTSWQSVDLFGCYHRVLTPEEVRGLPPAPSGRTGTPPPGSPRSSPG